MPHFQIVTVEGDALGATELRQGDWTEGCVIDRGDDQNLRVVGRIETDNAENFTMLIVELV